MALCYRQFDDAKTMEITGRGLVRYVPLVFAVAHGARQL